MTKEIIMSIIENHIEQRYNGYEFVIDSEIITDKLLELIEQEKKEVARKIFEKLAEEGYFTYDYPDEPHSPIVIYNADILQDLAEEYGVEL